MEIYLIRHAEALDLGERGITTDEERPLSENGEAQAEAAGRAFQMRGITLDKLVTSPLLRARQTAEILLRVWSRPELVLETSDALAPDVKMRKVSKAAMKAGAERIGLVGHMPGLGDFAAWLLGSKKVQIDLAKAGVVLITCDSEASKGSGVLQWMVTPDWY